MGLALGSWQLAVGSWQPAALAAKAARGGDALYPKLHFSDMPPMLVVSSLPERRASVSTSTSTSLHRFVASHRTASHLTDWLAVASPAGWPLARRLAGSLALGGALVTGKLPVSGLWSLVSSPGVQDTLLFSVRIARLLEPSWREQPNLRVLDAPNRGRGGENRGRTGATPPPPSLTPQRRHNRTIFSKTVPSIDSLGQGGYIIAQEGI
jgi:hypothetical protein